MNLTLRDRKQSISQFGRVNLAIVEDEHLMGFRRSRTYLIVDGMQHVSYQAIIVIEVLEPEESEERGPTRHAAEASLATRPMEGVHMALPRR